MNINNVEWGNISLPGLSDEDLYGKDWIKIGALKDYYRDPKKRQAIAERVVEQHANETEEEKRLRIQKTKETEGWKNSIETLREEKKKPIITPDGLFDSMATAAEHFSVDVSTIKNRIVKDPTNWNYADPNDRPAGKKQSKATVEHRAKKNQKPIMTPAGLFNSRKEAALGNKVSTVTVTNKLNNDKENWYYIIKETK